MLFLCKHFFPVGHQILNGQIVLRVMCLVFVCKLTPLSQNCLSEHTDHFIPQRSVLFYHIELNFTNPQFPKWTLPQFSICTTLIFGDNFNGYLNINDMFPTLKCISFLKMRYAWNFKVKANIWFGEQYGVLME